MAERGEAAGTSASRDDRETLLEIARMITGADPSRHPNGTETPEGADNNGAATVGDDFPLSGETAGQSFEDAPEGMALCSNGDLTRANPSFALAFGYPSPEALIAAGGLNAVFPDLPAAMTGYGKHQVLDAVTRSRRQVKMPVAIHEIAGEDGASAMLLVLNPEDPPEAIETAVDSAAANQESHSAAACGMDNPETPETPLARQEDTASPGIGKKSRKQRANAEAAFLARVSHDIRTPLNSIIGFAQLMKAEQAGPLGSERYHGYIRDILESGEYALNLINDLMIISRIDSGAFALNFAAVDVSELAAECVAAVQPQAHKQRVFLRVSLDEGLPLALADRPTLERILVNLLRNAVKFTRPGGQVILEARTKSSGAVRLRVQDNGPGMSDAEIERAMQPFSQSDTAPRDHLGNGLTLPLTRALAKANRAKFRLDSAAGRGTRITVTFPASRTIKR